jgi:hypothetical protein
MKIKLLLCVILAGCTFGFAKEARGKCEAVEWISPSMLVIQ